MKATINGIAVEGTPQEIVDYQRIVSGINPMPNYPLPSGTNPFALKPQITCGDYTWNGPLVAKW